MEEAVEWRPLPCCRHLHLERRDTHHKGHPLVRESNEGTFCHTVQTNNVIAVVGEPFSRPQTRVLAHDAVSFDHNLLTGLIRYNPFAASDRYRFHRLIVNRDKVNKWIRSVRGRLECLHVDNLVDNHTEIGHFPKRYAHVPTMRHVERKVSFYG